MGVYIYIEREEIRAYVYVYVYTHTYNMCETKICRLHVQYTVHVRGPGGTARHHAGLSLG